MAMASGFSVRERGCEEGAGRSTNVAAGGGKGCDDEGGGALVLVVGWEFEERSGGGKTASERVGVTGE
jgi:hypothetical protein